MKTKLQLLLLLVLCTMCGQPQKNYVAKVKLLQLDEDNFYDKELVYDVIFDAQELEIDSVKNLSRQLFLQGMDQFINKKNPTQAVELLKKSIRVFPDAKTYYELGNAIVESQLWTHEAIKAYEVADHLQFQPKANINFAKATAYAKIEQEKQQNEYRGNAYSELYRAFENGFSDTLLLFKNPSLKLVYNSPEFQKRLGYLRMSQEERLPDNQYALFLKSFKPASQPFEIPLDKVDMKAYNQAVSYDFAKFIPEMQNTSFGRDVSHDFFFVAKVAETPQYTALLYSSVSFYEEDMQPVLTKLVTFNSTRKQIASLLFSCQCSAEKVKKGKIENNLITLEDFKRIWKQPIDKVSFEENSVLKYEPLATATYRLTDTGEIVAEEVPANYKDTKIIASKN
ncbi:hypothetical protein [Nibribacter koreensis]|uniref:Tetratricopeptide repeat-containing protein n=1 Tax=Nibribacter koreensis TaxID=1084519 RepID=A0ABP8F5C4_9BACT